MIRFYNFAVLLSQRIDVCLSWYFIFYLATVLVEGELVLQAISMKNWNYRVKIGVIPERERK